MSNLSFIENIQANLPEMMIGTYRLKTINTMLNENPDWKKECYFNLKKLLRIMTSEEASDIDLGGPRTNGYIWFRVYGDKTPAQNIPKYKDDEVSAIILSILTIEQKEIFFKEKNLDFSITMYLEENEAPFRFRGDVFYERNTLAVNFRLINQDLFSMEDLQFPTPIVKRVNLKFEKSGLILITGITGSGKSSTLDSIINLNNTTNNAHIIIIGNPIEYIHQSQKSLVTHREVGEDVLSFGSGSIEALRQDPDIIVVGEMRDAKTISTVLEVTGSGHKVFSTLHTSSTVESIHRIIAEFPPDEQERIRFRLADTLKVVISQKLVPNRRGSLTLAKGILSINPSIQAAIRNNNISEIFQMITEGKNMGMFTLQQDLYRLVKTAEITPETAMNFANNRKIMHQLLKYG
ncbi:MAG: Flp pilus assembly complex ATPase component TadA [Candidatus Cloacimonetes bacterium]|nr:Flp pilus assembly complex ATPase component TadA [Candidatus Cloacimonadota bacterium]